MAMNDGCSFPKEDVSHERKCGIQGWKHTLIMEHSKWNVVHLQQGNKNENNYKNTATKKNF